MRKITTILTLAAALAMGMGSVAQAAPVADKELCKNGGFANYVDPTTDLPFKNQGRCVSFVNGGGVLTSVEEEPPVPVAPTVKIGDPIWAFEVQGRGGVHWVPVEFQGQPDTTYDLVISGAYEHPRASLADYTKQGVTNAEGLALFHIQSPAQSPYSVSFEERVLGSGVTPPASTTPRVKIGASVSGPPDYAYRPSVDKWTVPGQIQGSTGVSYPLEVFVNGELLQSMMVHADALGTGKFVVWAPSESLVEIRSNGVTVASMTTEATPQV